MLHGHHFNDEYVQSMVDSDLQNKDEGIPYSDRINKGYIPQWIAPYVAHAKAMKDTILQSTDSDENDLDGD